MGGFYCNLEGQMEMTGPNCEVASSQASVGTLLAIKQRLRELHQLLLDPPKVGCVCLASLGIKRCWVAKQSSWLQWHFKSHIILGVEGPADHWTPWTFL